MYKRQGLEHGKRKINRETSFDHDIPVKKERLAPNTTKQHAQEKDSSSLQFELSENTENVIKKEKKSPKVVKKEKLSPKTKKKKNVKQESAVQKDSKKLLESKPSASAQQIIDKTHVSRILIHTHTPCPMHFILFLLMILSILL